MAELVAHEVEVRAAGAGERGEARHLVERYAAVRLHAVLVHAHAPVDRLVHELEEERLAAHKRLVVRLDVAHHLLVGALVRERMEEAVHVPVLVAHLLREMEPVVRLAHRHAVIEAHAAVREWRGAAGHAAHVLCHGDRARMRLVDHAVREGEIAPGVVVHVAVEVLRVAHEVRAEAVVAVEHGRDAVEAVAVEVERVEPVAAVGEEEVQHLGLAVVEAARVPRGVPAARTVVEILVGRAVEEGESVALVPDGVGVHEVHDHQHPHAMRRVHEAHEVLGRAETRTRREEARHVVAEARVVGMLHHGHQLHHVVAGRLDARENVVAELRVGADLPLLLRHPHVRLVDARRLAAQRGPRARAAVLPQVGLLRLPHLRAEQVRLRVLHDATRVRRDALAASAVPVHLKMVELSVVDRAGREGALPHVRAGDARELEARGNVPLREVAHEPHLRRVRRPFAEHPPRRRAVQAEVLVRARPVGETPLPAGQFARPVAGMRGPTAHRVRVRGEVRVVKQARTGAPSFFATSSHAPYFTMSNRRRATFIASEKN